MRILLSLPDHLSALKKDTHVTLESKTQLLLTYLTQQKIVPVLIVEDAHTAVEVARALVKGGLKAIEITLRTAKAIEAIERVAQEVEGAVVGAGTVLDGHQWTASQKAGARFMVAPGSSPALLDVAAHSELPFLPGIASASEAMALREKGYRLMKFFPAEQAGGAPYLEALASPLADLKFCPTGSISNHNYQRYLALPNVVCVGGSWVAPKSLIATRDWEAITALARNTFSPPLNQRQASESGLASA